MKQLTLIALILTIAIIGLLSAQLIELSKEQAEFVRMNRAKVNPHPTNPYKAIITAISNQDTITVIREEIVAEIADNDTIYTTILKAENKEIEKINKGD